MDGVDYFFVSKQEFEEKIAADELLEHASVYNEYKVVPFPSSQCVACSVVCALKVSFCCGTRCS